MTNNLQEKIITIKESTNLDPNDTKPVNLKDENGDKYVLWKTSKNDDGSTRPSMAYTIFSKYPYGGQNATIGIVYKSEQKSFTNQDGKQIDFTQRTIVVVKDPSQIKPQNQVPNQVSQPAQPAPQQNYQAQKPASQNRDFEKEAFGKCKFGFLIEAYKLGKPLATAETEAELWAKSACRVMTGPNTSLGQSGQTYTPAPPMTEQVVQEQSTPTSTNERGEEDEIKIENIPF